MPKRTVAPISRRAVALGLTLAAVPRLRSVQAQERTTPRAVDLAGQPLFSSGGPNADLYGAADHYPVPGLI